MAIFPNVYVAMVMISTMGIISMSISYCPYALLGQYHEMKEVQTSCNITDETTDENEPFWHILYHNDVNDALDK